MATAAPFRGGMPFTEALVDRGIDTAQEGAGHRAQLFGMTATVQPGLRTP